jgi:hypothetical protein
MRCYGKDDHESERQTVSEVTGTDESGAREQHNPVYPRITIAFSPVPVRVFPDLST